MSESSGSGSSVSHEGDYMVHYDENGVETGREYYGSGDDSGGGPAGSGSGSGSNSRAARVSAIREACQSICSAISSLFQNSRNDSSTGQRNFLKDISDAVKSIKTAAQKLIPQSKKEKSKQISDDKSDGPGSLKQDGQILKDDGSNLLKKVSQTSKVDDDSIVFLNLESKDVEVHVTECKNDPVIISSGVNRQTNTDLTLGSFGGMYAVTRHYAPCNDRGGLLGSSWACSLDTRIIRGLDPDRTEEIQKLRETLTAIQEKKAEIEALDSSYDEVKGDIEAAAAEADTAIAGLEADIAPLEAAQAVRERNIERNKCVMYGGTQTFAECGDGKLILMKDGFIPLLFERAEDGSYRGTGSARLMSITEAGDGYTLSNSDGSTQRFDSCGRLSGEADRNGNEIKAVWGTDGKLEEIISPAGCSIKVETDEAGHITAMSLLQDGEETGHTVRYSYSGDRLASVTDPDGDTSRYEYDEENHLSAIVKPDGSAMRYAYTQCEDGSMRVASVTDEEGQVMAFSHDPAARRFSYTPAGGDEEVSLYDADGRITREEAAGLVTEYEYDADGNVTSRTVNGERTEYSYDEKGNLTKAVYADGSAVEYEYNSLGQLTGIKDRDGVAETFVRDEKGNLTELHTDGVCVAKYSYDGHGLCTEKEIARGGRKACISYSYDAHGRCVERCLSDPDNAEGAYTEKYEYDTQGRLIKLTSPDGKETCISYTAKTETVLFPGGLERRLTYDGRKNLVLVEETDRKRGRKLSVYCEYDKSHHVTKRVYSERDRTLVTEEMSYNARGDLASVTTSAAGDGTKKRQLLSYDGAGRITSVRIQKIGPDGTVEDETERKASFRYIGAGRELTVTSGEGRASTIYSDGLGRLVKQTNALGEEFTKSLSPAGRLLSESSSHGGMYAYGYDALGLLAAAGEEGKEQSKADYNPDGSVKKTTDRLGNVTEYFYDVRGLLIKQVSPDGTSLYGYDLSGRLTEFQRGDRKIHYSYSADGRTVTVTRGDSVTETYELDAWGRVIKATDGEGGSRTFTRDALGRLTDEADAYGNESSYRYNAWGRVSERILPDGSREAYEYNALGLSTKKTDSEGTAWVLRYDRDGLLLEEKSRARAVREYAYDALGRLTEVRSGGETQARYEYTAYGRKETLIRAGGGRYVKEYDAYGRLVSETDSTGATRTFAYDAEGRVRERKSFGGNVTQITDDRAGRSYGEAFPDGTENRVLLDESRAVIKEENPRASEEYEYDAAGLLVRQKSALTGETIEYSYDGRGLCTGVKSPIHHAVYEYGKAGELLHASDKTTGVSLSFKYDSLMRETERTFAGGARQLTAYDKAGRIASIRTLDRNGEVKSEYVHRGEGGKILATMDERGRVTLYGYDKQGRVSKVLYPFTNDILSKAKLEYESAGGDRNAHADSKDITIGEPIKKAFKQLSGRECQSSQKAWEESYRYDADGNRTSKTNALGTVYYKYDSENRLVSYGVTEAADTARLEYDADGNLIKESSCTKEAVYAYNAANRMAESHITEIRGGSRQTPKDTVYSYDSFGRRILEADILNRWVRHTEYRGLSMDVWKNAAVHGIKEPRESRGIDSTGMVFKNLNDFLPAFADFSRASPYDFTHVALTLPLTAGGEVLGLLQTEHSGIGFNPFVNASHTDAERHYFGKDHLGSVRAVTNQWGSPLYMFDYDVFGTPLQDRPERFRHGFTGKEFDSWTGLYNYGFRDYSPLSGRFTTVDPIQDGLGWYAYVNSDPVNWLDPWGLEGKPSGEDSKSDVTPDEIAKVYFIYVYKTDDKKDQKMKASERKSINDEIKFLQNNGVSVTVIENGTYEDIKEALEDKNIKMLVTSGHGTRGGSIETSTGGRFSPSDLEKINVSGSLKTVIFENCYQGGSNKKTDDNEKRWEEAFGENVDVVGWKDTTTTGETKSFNGYGWFDRQPRNLRSYCEDILKMEE